MSIDKATRHLSFSVVSVLATTLLTFQAGNFAILEVLFRGLIWYGNYISKNDRFTTITDD